MIIATKKSNWNLIVESKSIFVNKAYELINKKPFRSIKIRYYRTIGALAVV